MSCPPCRSLAGRGHCSDLPHYSGNTSIRHALSLVYRTERYRYCHLHGLLAKRPESSSQLRLYLSFLPPSLLTLFPSTRTGSLPLNLSFAQESIHHISLGCGKSAGCMVRKYHGSCLPQLSVLSSSALKHQVVFCACPSTWLSSEMSRDSFLPWQDMIEMTCP